MVLNYEVVKDSRIHIYLPVQQHGRIWHELQCSARFSHAVIVQQHGCALRWSYHHKIYFEVPCTLLPQCTINMRKYKISVYIPLYSNMVAVRRSYYTRSSIQYKILVCLILCNNMVAVRWSHLKISSMSCKIFEYISIVQHGCCTLPVSQNRQCSARFSYT